MLTELVAALSSVFKTRPALQLENLALRHQLGVLHRSVKKPKLTPLDRLLWAWLCGVWADWRSALIVVKPETVHQHIAPSDLRQWCILEKYLLRPAPAMSSDGFHENPSLRSYFGIRSIQVGGAVLDTATTLTHHRQSGTNPLGREVAEVERLSDVDLAVELASKEADFDRARVKNYERVEELATKGHHFRNFLEREGCWYWEVFGFLKGQNRVIALADYSVEKTFVRTVPHRFLIGQPEQIATQSAPSTPKPAA